MASSGADRQAGERSGPAATTVARVSRRFMPFLMICYLVSYLDRVNVSAAALTANRDLGFTPLVYAWGSGIFFVGYLLFEVPSNLILERVGARRWIARIMISWGLIAGAMAWIQGPASFMIVRVLLGAAEAGFFPGIILYTTYWFPRRERAARIGLFMLAIPLASLVGQPIAAALLQMDGILGLKGWQWLYLIEALPAVLLGIAVLFWLDDRPEAARWLGEAERDWLVATLAAERAERRPAAVPWWRLLADRRVLLHSAVFFGITAPSYGVTLWLPQIVKGFRVSDTSALLLSAVPYLFGSIAMWAWGRQSDRDGERIRHTAAAALVAALGLALSASTGSLALALVGISLACVGIFGVKGPYWALATEAFPGPLAAPALAIVSSIGNFSGFVAPYMIGWVKTVTGGYGWGLVELALVSALAAGLVLLPAARPRQAFTGLLTDRID